MAYNFSQRSIPMAQKLINARMTAQVAALAGIAMFGAAAGIQVDGEEAEVQEKF